MLAKFVKDTELFVIDTIESETEEEIGDHEYFREGTKIDCDLISNHDSHYYVQFPNGSVANIPLSVIEVLELSESDET